MWRREVCHGVIKKHSIEEQLDTSNPLVNDGPICKTDANEMAEKSFEKTSDPSKLRIHTLKMSYRECKGKFKKSRRGRKTCNFFKELDSILGNRPASSPLQVIENLLIWDKAIQVKMSKPRIILDIVDILDNFSDINPFNDNPRISKPKMMLKTQRRQQSVMNHIFRLQKTLGRR